MKADPPPSADPSTALTPGWKTMVGVLALYLGSLVVATWPAFTTFKTELPSRVDPIAHLWTMRWNKQCLMEGKAPWYCPDIQYPVGAALGSLPPMHFQTLLYIPLSFAFDNDVLCYNLIRTFSFLLTGVGTFLLIWNVVRDRMAATLGGLFAMLGEPMIFFSQGELEQITVGWFPIFAIAWMRLVDRPTWRNLAASAGLYLLVAMSAPYFGVFATFPASLYVAWRFFGAGRANALGWLKARMAWLAAFAAFTAPAMVLLFSNQVWAMKHGYPMARPEGEFSMFRAPLWGYLVPSPMHRLSRILPFDTFIAGEMGAVPSYLGVVSIALIAYAAMARVRFARRGYWWAVFAMLLVLSLGGHGWMFGHDVSLPAAWLKKYFVGFRMIRVPARFNLFAAVAASVVAAAGARQLLAKVANPGARLAVFAGLVLVAVADLSVVPYQTRDIPPMPACYRAILKDDPSATFVDVPQFNSGAMELPSMSAYWQSFHRGKTAAGYTAFANTIQDNLMAYNSPFDAFKLADPAYLLDPKGQKIELARDVDIRSYAWLYLTVHDLRYVVVHHRPGAFPEMPVRVDRLEAALADALVYNDADTAVFDRDKLPKPDRPTFLYTKGWDHRVFRWGVFTCMLKEDARIEVYNPTPDQPMMLTLDASSHRKPRTLTLLSEGAEVARWSVDPKDSALLASPPFRLPAGLHEIALRSDGEERPSRVDAHIETDKSPFSLWVTGVGVVPATDRAVAGRKVGDRVVR